MPNHRAMAFSYSVFTVRTTLAILHGIHSTTAHQSIWFTAGLLWLGKVPPGKNLSDKFSFYFPLFKREKKKRNVPLAPP